MSDLDLVFSTLDRLEAPVSWREVKLREPRQLPPEPGLARRLVVAAVALLVAAAGIGLAVSALSTGGTRPAAARNGLIAFELWRPNDRDTDHLISVVDPGTGVVSNLLASDSHLYAQPAWSPDGSRLAFARQDDVGNGRWGIWVINADGSGLRSVHLEKPEGGIGSGEPSFAIGQIAWSPNGDQIAFIRIDRSSPREADWIERLYVMDVDGSNLTPLTEPDLQVHQFAWSPDGTTILLAGQPVGLGRADPHLFVMNADGSGLTPLDQAGSYPSWSPDGARIVFAGQGGEESSGDIFVMNADGTGKTQLTDTPGPEWGPVWSPDGRQVAFLREGPSGWEACGLAIMDADGSHARTLVKGSNLGGCLFNAAWQPVPGDGSTPTEEPTPSVSETSPIDPRVTATIPVGRFPTAVAVGEGAVWATVDNADGGPKDHLLVRIDPMTNEIVATLPLPEAGDLAVGEGAVWVLSREAPEGTLVRIDPSTNDIVATIPVGNGLSNVAVGEGAVWVTTANDGSPPSGEVIRIDPTTNEVVARIPVSGGWPRDLVTGEGWVWTYGHSRLGEHGWEASSLWRIDPATNEASVLVDREGFLGDGEPLPDNVAVGEGYVWAADDHGRGLRIDPATGEVTRFEVEGGFAWPFLVTAGHVWFGRSEIGLLDTQTLEVVDVVEGRIENVESAFDSATATLWVANYKGTVTRVEWR